MQKVTVAQEIEMLTWYLDIEKVRFEERLQLHIDVAPGVAHALRSIGNRDLIMVYGTSTTFNPDWEGRIASGIENSPLPADWAAYLAADSS
jgi:dTDP-4-dehydrorhamnose 3,5-epimerase-like enzyme